MWRRPVGNSRALRGRRGYGHCGDSFPASNKPHLLIGGGLDPDKLGIDPKSGSNLLLHLFAVWQDSWSFSDESAVNIDDGGTLLFCEAHASFEDLQAGDSLDGPILGGEVVTDIWKSESSEDGISNGMGEDIRIGMPLQSLGMRNFYATENEWSVSGELVDIVTNSNAVHDQWASGGIRGALNS